jgi:hypothetical protein
LGKKTLPPPTLEDQAAINEAISGETWAPVVLRPYEQ